MTSPEESNVELPKERSFWERKGTILTAICDEVHPISDEMPEDVAEAVDAERQLFVMRSGLNQMSPDELEALWLETHETLPYAEAASADEVGPESGDPLLDLLDSERAMFDSTEPKGHFWDTA